MLYIVSLGGSGDLGVVLAEVGNLFSGSERFLDGEAHRDTGSGGR